MRKVSLIYDGGLWTKKNASGVHIIEILKNLANEYDVLLVAPRKEECMLHNQKFNIGYIPIFAKSAIRFVIYEITLFVYLFLHFIKSKPDIIYARSKIGIASLSISLLFNTPRVVEVNGLSIEDTKMRNESAIRIKIIAVTPGLKKKIEELYNIPDEKVVVIENGANTDLFKPLNKNECVRELNLPDSFQYVCFVGNLAPWQGVEYLIEVAPLILKKVPNTKFLIVGDGMMKEKLIGLAEKTGISDKVIFTGTVPYEEVPKYINASDVCISPFIRRRNETTGVSPLKIYEYLSCQKPVVSSRIPNLEFIEQQNTGILVEPESPDKLAKTIIKLLEDEKLREEMGKNGREYVVKNHSWEMVARRVESVINEVVETEN